ncbi:MAG: DUF424 family protein [Nanohaloarchaea archaeon]|nr:DUF424 family protein [Candidatus Nanohaloarchaea archaeon]
MFILKTYNTDTGSIVSVCDSDILGKRFEDNDKVLDISDYFYNGTEADIKTIISAISASTSAVISGNKIISALKEQDIITEEHILSVAGTQYAMIFKV